MIPSASNIAGLRTSRLLERLRGLDPCEVRRTIEFERDFTLERHMHEGEKTGYLAILGELLDWWDGRREPAQLDRELQRLLSGGLLNRRV